jgi:hypothetical protein
LRLRIRAVCSAMGKPATKEPPAGSSAVEPGPSEQPADAQQDTVVIPAVEGQVAQEELEEETCGFCKFMKAGPCGTVFKVSRACLGLSPSRSSERTCLGQTLPQWRRTGVTAGLGGVCAW